MSVEGRSDVKVQPRGRTSSARLDPYLTPFPFSDYYLGLVSQRRHLKIHQLSTATSSLYPSILTQVGAHRGFGEY